MRTFVIISILLVLLGCNIPDAYLNDKVQLSNVNLIKIHIMDSVYEFDKSKNYDFLLRLGKVKSNDGIWKFYKKANLILTHVNGESDTLLTDGIIFAYKNYYFVSDTDIIKSVYGISISGH